MLAWSLHQWRRGHRWCLWGHSLAGRPWGGIDGSGIVRRRGNWNLRQPWSIITLHSLCQSKIVLHHLYALRLLFWCHRRLQPSGNFRLTSLRLGFVKWIQVCHICPSVFGIFGAKVINLFDITKFFCKKGEALLVGMLLLCVLYGVCRLCQLLDYFGDLLLGVGVLLYLLYAVFNVGAFLGLLTESLTV